MSVPPHRRAYWFGSDNVSVTQQVPRGTEVKVIREEPNDKLRVQIKPGQGLKEEEFTAFRDEVWFD